MDVMMGDLVLLEKEVNPVMSALLDNSLEATALHNHFFFEEPRIFYMHVHGHGKAEDLARRAKPAVDLIGNAARPAPASGTGSALSSSIGAARIAQHSCSAFCSADSSTKIPWRSYRPRALLKRTTTAARALYFLDRRVSAASPLAR